MVVGYVSHYRSALLLHRRRRGVLVLAGLLVLVVPAGTWLSRQGPAAGPHVEWAFSPASNTVTVRVVPAPGKAGRRVLRDSRLTVSRNGGSTLSRGSPGDKIVRISVPPARRTRLLVRLAGPRPLRRALTVTAPPPPRLITSRDSTGRLMMSVSSPLYHEPHQRLCGMDDVSFPALSQVAVSEGPTVCRSRLRLRARNGETADVPVTIPARGQVPLYSFARPTGRAVYITIDDGWYPSEQVLAIMRRTHVPITAFLIQRAAREHLSYWRAFVRAGGAIGDHTVSHPDLTGLTPSQATAQWGQARRALGRWFGRLPVLGRPPYGDFNSTVEAAAARAGLTALAGFSATVKHDQVVTWDGKPLRPGEIVVLHWDPGVGRQLTTLLAAIRALHLRPAALTPVSFSGSAPGTRSLSGD